MYRKYINKKAYKISLQQRKKTEKHLNWENGKIFHNGSLF